MVSKALVYRLELIRNVFLLKLHTTWTTKKCCNSKYLSEIKFPWKLDYGFWNWVK